LGKILKADLHTHSTASDGLNTPTENIILAKKAGLFALGITDHDSIAGIDEAIKAGLEQKVEAIPGIEMSTVDKGQDVHMLGYFLNYQDKEFIRTLTELTRVRERRNEMMIERLNEIGIPITIQEVTAKLRREGAHVGRPHIAEVLIDKGIIKTMEEAFDLYLGREGKAYVNPPRILPEESIEIIKQAGGVPILAHPGVYDDDELVVRLIKNGLAGIEAFHPDHNQAGEKKYFDMANRYGIIATAGSDFHGSRGEEIFHALIGTKTVNMTIVEEIRDLAGKS